MIREFRESLGLSQGDFAGVCDVDERSIRNWESGRWPKSLAVLLSVRLVPAQVARWFKERAHLGQDQITRELLASPPLVSPEQGARWLELRGQIEREHLKREARAPSCPTQLLSFKRLAGDASPCYTFLPGSEPVVFEDEQGRRYPQLLRGTEPQELTVPETWRLVEPS